MDKNRLIYKNPVFLMVCTLIVMTPLFRGSVHAWAQTLIQIAAVAGVIVLVINKDRAEHGSSFAESDHVFILLSCMLPVLTVTMASAVFSPGTNLPVDGVLMFLTYLAVFYMTVHTVNTRAEQRTLVSVIVCTAIFISVIGVLKRFGINFLWLWEYPDINWAYYKSLTGPYVNRNHMAGFLDMAIPLLLGLFLTKERTREKNLGMVCMVLFLIVTQGLTLSRGGWTATACALVFMMVVLLFQKSFKRKVFLIAMAADRKSVV